MGFFDVECATLNRKPSNNAYRYRQTDESCSGVAARYALPAKCQKEATP
jgi:hypothetical protein